MANYVLTCCSTADMNRAFFTQREIPFVCFHVVLNGETYPDDLGETLPFPEFYKRIAEGAMPTTSQVNVEQYLAFFEPFLQEGKDILHVSLSTGLSGSFNSAGIAREQLLEKYPERRIFLVDSLAASSGYGLLMTLAADKRDAGASIEELDAYIEERKLHVHHWFFSTDLTHYRRGGRITAASAVVGTLFNICPLLNMDNHGRLIPRAKYRGKHRIAREIVDRMEACADNGLDYSGYCYISNSACYEDARIVADLVEERFPKLIAPVVINSVGTVIGAHTGPGTVALFFTGSLRID